MESIKTLKKYNQLSLIVLFLLGGFATYSQISPEVYAHRTNNNGKEITHQLKLTKDYLLYTIYESNPVNFIKTIGGFYKINTQKIKVVLEFNSNYKTDSLKIWSAPITKENNNLILELSDKKVFKPEPKPTQDLDGVWLFATRGPNNGQDRRGEENSRKTLKFLSNGTFQWIAYDTNSFEFSGTGGGSYSANKGVYTEYIEFFSRDSSRVGATLEFNYELMGNDWHHTGKNSKGEPMYEIWARRQ